MREFSSNSEIDEFVCCLKKKAKNFYGKSLHSHTPNHKGAVHSCSFCWCNLLSIFITKFQFLSSMFTITAMHWQKTTKKKNNAKPRALIFISCQLNSRLKSFSFSMYATEWFISNKKKLNFLCFLYLWIKKRNPLNARRICEHFFPKCRAIHFTFILWMYFEDQ